MDTPRLSILAHCTGRLIDTRDRYGVDMARIIRRARERGCFLELNAHPDRLDLTDIHRQMARGEGDPGEHRLRCPRILDFANLVYGIGQARRDWLEKADVLNTRLLLEL